MNKRQAKKFKKKEELLFEMLAGSYDELRFMKRKYHDCVVLKKRQLKKCKGCEFFLIDTGSWSRFLMIKPCVKG